MEDSDDFICSLYRRGVDLWTEAGKLRFSAPKGALSGQDMERLRVHKERVIQHIQQVELANGTPARTGPLQFPMPLTALQMRKWRYVTEKRGGLSERTCVIAESVTGPLEFDRLQESVHLVVRRHEALRLRIVVAGSTPAQQVAEDPLLHLELLDLESVCDRNGRDRAIELCEQFVNEEVSLEAGPLFAARLFRRRHDEHIFSVVMHHMISDAFSCQLVAKEIWSAYRQLAEGSAPRFPVLLRQFPDYVLWQHRTREAWFRSHADYWRHRMQDVPANEAVFGLPPVACERRYFSLSGVLSSALRDLANRERSFIALVMFTVYVEVMSRWLNRRDLIVSFVSNGRGRAELQNMVGFLADYLHLRIQKEPSDGFLDLLRRVTGEFRSAFDHQDYGRVPDFVPNCIPDVGFNWISEGEAQGFAGDVFGDRLKVRPVALKRSIPLQSPPQIALAFRDKADGIVGVVVYRPDCFEANDVDRLCRDLELYASQIVSSEARESPVTPRVRH